MEIINFSEFADLVKRGIKQKELLLKMKTNAENEKLEELIEKMAADQADILIALKNPKELENLKGSDESITTFLITIWTIIAILILATAMMKIYTMFA